MKSLLKKRMSNEKGLTLVELLAVIVILGIIAAIAVPSIGNIINNSKIKATKADAQTALSAGNMYFIENPEKPDVTLADLIKDGFLQDEGSLTSDVKITKSPTGGNTIAGTGGKEPNIVTFTKATSKNISDSKNLKAVSATAPTP